MALDLGLLVIDKIIVHEVPGRQRNQPVPPPTLSDAPSPLDSAIKNFFRERIVRSLSDAACEVIFDDDLDQTTPDLCDAMLKPRDRKFVENSRGLATQLHSVQTAATSGGLLGVALGNLGGKSALAVMKLEKESGVRVQHSKTGNKVTLSLQHLQDLMLTGKTRVFKVGLFVQSGTGKASIKGLVSDSQRSHAATEEVAAFFLRHFLSCKMKDDSAAATRNFISITQGFINDQVTNAGTKAKYQVALAAELASTQKTVKPTDFARRTMSPAYQDSFRDRLQEAGFVSAEFDKDPDTVEALLGKMQMEFESGIVVVVPQDSYDGHVSATTSRGVDTVTIKDKLKRLKGRR